MVNTGEMGREVLRKMLPVRYIWLFGVNVPSTRTVVPVVHFMGFSAQAGLPLTSTLEAPHSSMLCIFLHRGLLLWLKRKQPFGYSIPKPPHTRPTLQNIS